MHRAIITVLGKDRVGIIYNVTKVLSEFNINVLDINQTIMDGKTFTMVMLVDTEGMNKDYKDVVDALAAKGEELGVSIRMQREDVFNAMHSIG
ncbi:MAG: ACT domain-containing protein [Clostridia bacterium]|jgi:ACT domain-containing protein|nr:ACT domain-containing protein [Clostridia bacterium]